MDSVYEQYTRELHDRFGYLATWLPNSPLKLGDIGILTRDRFEAVTSLDLLGVPFEHSTPGAPADYEYTSRDGVDIAFESKGALSGPVKAIADGSVALSVRFARGKAVLFVARGCRLTSVLDRKKLGDELLRRFKRGTWPQKHVVVSEIVTAESSTILISSKGGAHADFSASGSAAPQGVRLADVAGGLSLMRSSGIDTSIVSAAALTPLFRASGIRRRLFGTDVLVRGSLAPAKTPVARPRESFLFADLGYDDVTE